MKRLRIIVEGQAEEEFVTKSLRPYFADKGIYDISAIKIQTSKVQKGGFPNYAYLKNDITNLLREPNIIVSTFVDFFRIPTSVPGYLQMQQISNVDGKIDALQNAMAADINDHRFIPYIQKFEFEALLFSSNEGFVGWYDKSAIHTATEAIVNQYENPEEINNNPNTSPSKRLKKILSDNGEKYSKVVEGNLIAEEIGIDKILEKCPRFRAWVECLIEACQEDTLNENEEE